MGSGRNIYKLPQDVGEAIKLVRRYASGFDTKSGFDLRKISKPQDMTKYQRAKLRRYFQVVQEGLSRTHTVLKPRNKKRLHQLQEAAGQQDFPKDLKVAFYPSAEKVTPKFDKKGKLQGFKTPSGIGIVDYKIDPYAFVNDPEAEIDRILGMTNANYFEIKAGDNHVREAYRRTDLFSAIENLALRYGGIEPGYIDEDSEDDDGHWKHWLTGVTAYHVPQAENFRKFRSAKYKLRDMREDLKHENKKKRKSPAKMLDFIRRMNAINLEQGLPLIDPEDYGL